MYLWQWSPRQDEWLLVTTAAEDKQQVVLRSYKRRNPKGTKFRWTDSEDNKPRRFRTRAKKGE